MSDDKISNPVRAYVQWMMERYEPHWDYMNELKKAIASDDAEKLLAEFNRARVFRRLLSRTGEWPRGGDAFYLDSRFSPHYYRSRPVWKAGFILGYKQISHFIVNLDVLKDLSQRVILSETKDLVFAGMIYGSIFRGACPERKD